MSKILHFKLDTITNGQATDLSGNGYHGTVQGGVTVVNDDTFGTCLEFNGTDGIITIDTAINPVFINHSFTVGAWVYLYDTGADKTILGNDTPGNNNCLVLMTRHGIPNLAFYYNDTQHTTVLGTDQWYYLTWIYDYDANTGTGSQIMYINGHDQVTGTSKAPLQGANQLNVGTWGGGGFFHGKLYGLRIYDTALSQSEVQSIMIADQSSSTFRTTYPIDFDLYDKDSQNVLYIEDTSEQLLTLRIKNAATETIQLTDLAAPVSNSHYHFALRLRPGTLSPVTLGGGLNGMQLAAETAQNWEMVLVTKENDASGIDAIYLRSKAPGLSLAPGDLQSLVFEHVGADAGQGARGTRVELLYRNMTFSGTPTLEINANREIHLSVINHRGKQNLPLHVGFVGDNGVLNDGATSNALTLRFSNTLVHDAVNPDLSQLTFLYNADATLRSKIILSFDAGVATEEWALATETELSNITVGQPTGWTITAPLQGESPEWILEPDTTNQVLYGKNDPDATHLEYFDLDITDIITAFPTGHTQLHIRYENIPGYWDGQMKLALEKRPLVYDGGNVGIGMVNPTERLEVNGTVKSDTLIANSIHSLPVVWEERSKLQASDAAADDRFGWSVAISGNWAIAGVPYEDTGDSNAGSAYLFHWDGNTWTQQDKIQASDAAADDQFGWSVAISGDWAIVGAPYKDIGGSNAGSAYLFLRDGNTWTETQKIQASDAEAYDWFGRFVAISGDRAIVGAPMEDSGGYEAGSAYLFHWDGNTWTETQKIQASDATADDQFGNSVAISGDWAIVGAYLEDTGGSNAGSAYLFYWDGNTWTETQKIQASDAAAEDWFGWSVAISGDWAIVGAPYKDTGGSGTGSAYLFYWDGNTWTETQKIQASDAEAFDGFGWSVAIIGNRAIVGASGEDTVGYEAGSAYLFYWDGNTWTETQKIQVLDAAAGDEFGRSVAISGDRAIVGAPYEDTGGSNAGSAYLFHLVSRVQVVMDADTGNIGIGTESPAHKLEVNGNIHADNVAAPGGDYAEYFESVDGQAIPAGTAVVLEEAKVRAAREGECPIGIVSARPMITGNLPGEWPGKYRKDDFGRIQTGADGTPVLNPEYDPEKTYVSRKARPEWNCIGLLGQLPLRKGQPVAAHWIRLKDLSETVALWLVK